MIALAFAVAQIIVCGLPVALLLRGDDEPSRARLLGTSFLLGSGAVYFVMLAVQSRVAVLIVTVVLWLVAWRVRRPRVHAAPARWTWVDALTLAMIVAHGILAAWTEPREVDFWTNWGLKARVFLERGGIDWAYLQDPFNAVMLPDYPLLMPLQYVFIALHGGGWDDRWLGLVTTLFGAALVPIVRDLFARELPPHLAAWATLAASAVALSQWIGLAETPMIAYGAAGLLLVRRREVVPGAVMLGLCACTKNEGIALIAATAAGLLVAGHVRDIVRLWPAAALAVPWMILRARHDLPVDFQFSAFNPAYLHPILEQLGRHPPERPLMWVGMAIAFAICAADLRRERFVLTAAALQVLFYLGAYFLTPYEVRWHVSHSWPRLLDHVAVPLLFVALALAGSSLRERDAGIAPM